MSKRIKLTFIISDIDKAVSFEWVAKGLMSTHQLSFILIGKENSHLYNYLKSQSLSVHQVSCSNSIQIFLSFFKVVWLLSVNRPLVIHTHLFKANLIGLTAAWLLRIKKRVYTRHHALVHHREHKKGLWMDKWCNYAATDIIAISENTKQILIQMDKTKPEKIRLIHHGFDLKYFQNLDQGKIKDLRRKWKIAADDKPVVGVVARYQEWKGIQYIIPAFQKLLQDYPNAHLILANAHGSYIQAIKGLLAKLPPSSFTEIPFENDLASLFQLFDIYVHTPIDAQSEAFGQTYIEALASGIPSVFTLSGVAPEFINHEKNALVSNFKDSDSILTSMLRLLKESDFCSQLRQAGLRDVQQFHILFMIEKLNELYSYPINR